MKVVVLSSLLIICGCNASLLDYLTTFTSQLTGVLNSTHKCNTFSTPWSHPDIGEFTNVSSSSPYCSSKCWRSTPCCQPQDPDHIVQFELWVNGTKNANITWNGRRFEQFKYCKQLTYVVHGLHELSQVSPSFRPMAEILSRTQCTVLVDWSRGSGMPYFQAIANVRTIGRVIGFHAFMVTSRFASITTKAIGFSIGGHVVGEAARYYTQRSGLKFNTCHGLEITGPGYDGCDDGIRLTANLCHDVQVIHTNAMKSNWLPVVSGLGTAIKSGMADWWVNCGRDQYDTCSDNMLLSPTRLIGPIFEGVPLTVDSWLSQGNNDELVRCAHVSVYHVYMSYIQGSCMFRGIDCPDCSSTCSNPGEGVATVPFMADNVEGDFKFQTGDLHGDAKCHV